MANDPLFNMGTEVASPQLSRNKLRKEIELNLGGGMIDLELDPEHYDLAIDKALDKYRTRSKNSVEESFIFLDVQEDTTQYVLPKEVTEVRRVYRRGIGTAGGNTGSTLDPFSSALINNLYTVPTTGAPDLVTYEFAMQQRELIGLMFGQEVLFTWNPQNKKITFHRRFTGAETFLVWCYNYQPDNVLMTEIYSRQWLRSWATAECKMMLGEARSTYAQIAGPQGGTTLNGEQLKSDAQAEMEKLEQDMYLQRDGGDEGYSFVIG